MADHDRLAPGTLTAVQIRNNASYLIANFPVATDQPQAVPWMLSDYGIVQDFVENTAGLDGYAGGFGRPWTTLTFDVLTSGMLAYLYATFFPTGGRTAAVTAQIRKRTLNGTSDADYVVYNGLLHKPPESELTIRVGLHFSGVTFRFTRLVVATDGGDFNEDFFIGLGGDFG